jgi:hypothetical protein
MKLRNYRKLLYWALHTYFGKCCCRSTLEPTQKPVIWAPYICVNTLNKRNCIFTYNNNNNNNNNLFLQVYARSKYSCKG